MCNASWESIFAAELFWHDSHFHGDSDFSDRFIKTVGSLSSWGIQLLYTSSFFLNEVVTGLYIIVKNEWDCWDNKELCSNPKFPMPFSSEITASGCHFQNWNTCLVTINANLSVALQICSRDEATMRKRSLSLSHRGRSKKGVFSSLKGLDTLTKRGHEKKPSVSQVLHSPCLI